MAAIPQARYCAFPALPPPVDVPMVEIPEPACGYFPDRASLTRAFSVGHMPGEIYQQFLDAGFRRSGRIIYQPVCRGCRACVPIRVPVESFSPSRSQRRTRRRNADLRIMIGPPEPTEEKFALYRHYQAGRHPDGPMECSWDSFVDYLYDSPIDTIECEYRDPRGRLLAVGICDLCPDLLSTVYFYYDPEESRRGLGTFGALQEIELTRRLGLSYYYLGYWITGCRTMEYKATFRPYEVLDADGVWRPPGHSGG